MNKSLSCQGNIKKAFIELITLQCVSENSNVCRDEICVTILKSTHINTKKQLHIEYFFDTFHIEIPLLCWKNINLCTHKSSGSIFTFIHTHTAHNNRWLGSLVEE